MFRVLEQALGLLLVCLAFDSRHLEHQVISITDVNGRERIGQQDLASGVFRLQGLLGQVTAVAIVLNVIDAKKGLVPLVIVLSLLVRLGSRNLRSNLLDVLDSLCTDYPDVRAYRGFNQLAAQSILAASLHDGFQPWFSGKPR